MKRLLCAAAIFAFVNSSVASAQTLAEIAKKERERREKLDAEVPTYTEADLEEIETPETTSTASMVEGPARAEDEEDEGETEESDPAQTRSYWQDRLSRIDQRIRDLETRLESPQYTMNPRGGFERQALERDLEAARAERQALFEEARRAGVPPGWLR